MTSATTYFGPLNNPGILKPLNELQIVRLWKDNERIKQYARLSSLQLQVPDAFVEKIWEMVTKLCAQIQQYCRFDRPSKRALSKVIGIFRTGLCLKNKKIIQFELAAQDISLLSGYSKSTVEQVLRILGCGPIKVNGVEVGQGLGILHRGRRTGWAYLEGKLKRAYRTSRTVVTFFGKLILGLLSKAEKEELNKQSHKSKNRHYNPSPKAQPQTQNSTVDKEEKHIQDMVTHEPPTAEEHEIGRAWFRKIKEMINA